jgi:hypothetical protein
LLAAGKFVLFSVSRAGFSKSIRKRPGVLMPEPEKFFMGQCAYVIDAGIGLVKIGLSGAPLQRVLDLQTGSPVKLSLEHVEPIANVAPQAVERTAHRLLEGAWSHGEWFFATVAQGIEIMVGNYD